MVCQNMCHFFVVKTLRIVTIVILLTFTKNIFRSKRKFEGTFEPNTCEVMKHFKFLEHLFTFFWLKPNLVVAYHFPTCVSMLVMSWMTVVNFSLSLVIR